MNVIKDLFPDAKTMHQYEMAKEILPLGVLWENCPNEFGNSLLQRSQLMLCYAIQDEKMADDYLGDNEIAIEMGCIKTYFEGNPKDFINKLNLGIFSVHHIDLWNLRMDVDVLCYLDENIWMYIGFYNGSRCDVARFKTNMPLCEIEQLFHNSYKESGVNTLEIDVNRLNGLVQYSN